MPRSYAAGFSRIQRENFTEKKHFEHYKQRMGAHRLPHPYRIIK